MSELEKAIFDGEPALEAGEQIVRKSAANLFRGIESVGGRLYLTDRRLVFQSHKFNLQSGAESWRFDEIVAAKPAMTMFLVPNGLLLYLTTGKRRRFVVWKRHEWAQEIASRLTRGPA